MKSVVLAEFVHPALMRFDLLCQFGGSTQRRGEDGRIRPER